MTRRRVVLMAVLAAGVSSAGPAGAQGLAAAVRPAPRPFTVGDPVALELRAALPSGALPLDSQPVLRDTLNEGVRILERGRWTVGSAGRAATVRLAFFRPGTTSTPVFEVAYRAAGGAIDTLRAAPLQVVIAPTLPMNAAAMKDIRDLLPLPGQGGVWKAIVVALALLGVAAAWLVRRRRRGERPPPAATAEAAPPASPYEAALQQLEQLERRPWQTERDAARYYQEAADVVRRYLEQAAGIEALRRTTPEVAWALPPAFAAAGLREAAVEILDEADLVKFARLRPGAASGRRYLARIRELLSRWHEREASLAEEASGALR